MTQVLELQTNTFEQEIKNSNVPVLVDFSASWCAPCKQQDPVLHELAPEIENQAKVMKVDVDQQQELAINHQIMSVPTLLLFHQGEIVKKWIGFTSKEELKQSILKYVEPSEGL